MFPIHNMSVTLQWNVLCWDWVRTEYTNDPTHVSLESAEQVTEEGMLDPEGERLPLDHGALDVIVLQHGVLPQGLYRVVVLGVAQLSKQHFAKTENKILLCEKSCIICYWRRFLLYLPFPKTLRNLKSLTAYFLNSGRVFVGAWLVGFFSNLLLSSSESEYWSLSSSLCAGEGEGDSENVAKPATTISYIM